MSKKWQRGVLAVALCATVLAWTGAEAQARQGRGGRQFNPDANFTGMTVHAVLEKTEGETQTEMLFTGTASAVSTPEQLTLTIDTLASDGNTATITVDNPLLYARKGKSYWGTGTAVVNVDGVDHTFDMGAKVKLRKNRKGWFMIARLKGKEVTEPVVVEEGGEIETEDPAVEMTLMVRLRGKAGDEPVVE